MATYKNWHVTYMKKKGILGGSEFGTTFLRDKTLAEAYKFVESTESRVLAINEITDDDDAKFLENRLPTLIPKDEQ